MDADTWRVIVPENRYFTVTEEREVKVSAASPTEAMERANRILSGTKTSEDQNDVQMEPRQTHLSVREERY